MLPSRNNSFSQLALWHQVPTPVPAGDFTLSCKISVRRALCPATWGDEQAGGPGGHSRGRGL